MGLEAKKYFKKNPPNLMSMAYSVMFYTIFSGLTAYIPVVYIPLAAAEAIFMSSGLLVSLIVFGFLTESSTKWIEVCVTAFFFI